MEQNASRRIGKYVTEKLLGRGAMGVVMLAKDPTIGRYVAVKVIHIPEGIEEDKMKEFRERFLREARSAGVMSHPNIVTVYEADEGSAGKPPFIAMEYIEGETWNKKIKRGDRFSPDQLFPLLRDVASALEYAHKAGVIHRDIKPGNIIQTTDSRVKLMDFGIAKVPTSELTREGQFLGTPAYMSPEQVLGKPVDKTCDLFSLGAVAYEMISGRKPFDGEEITAVLHKIVSEEPRDLRELNPEVSKEAWAIVKKLLRKNGPERYGAASELIADLDAYLAGALPPFAQEFVEKTVPPQDAVPAAGGPRAAKPASGKAPSRALIFAASASLLALVGMSIFLFFTFRGRGGSDYGVVQPEEIQNSTSAIKTPDDSASPSGGDAGQPVLEVKKEGFEPEKQPEVPPASKPKPKPRPSDKPKDPPPASKEVQNPKAGTKPEPAREAALNFSFDFGGTKKGEATLVIDGGRITRNKKMDKKSGVEPVWSETVKLPPGKHTVKVIFKGELLGVNTSQEEAREFAAGRETTLRVKIKKISKDLSFTWSE